MKAIIFLMMILVSSNLFAQNTTRTISGTVYDKTNKLPMPGVSVKVSGTNTGTLTDVKGNFTLTVTANQSKLQFTFVGYETQLVSIGKSDKITVWMQASSKQLNEVASIGYSTHIKADSEEYKASAYAIQPTAQALNGRLPGLYVTPQTARATRIKVNGKDFFGNDVKTATQNLPADIIEKIQVIDDYGNQAMTGIKTPEPTKILNVTVTGQAANNKTNTVNELLKKLPGIAIDANGNITAQGKAITKVRINGKLYNPPYRGVLDESYNPIIENPFTDPKSTPLSTFAVDVDAASYSNIRRFINAGQLPPKDAVRVEEMINYFHYNLPAPANSDPVAIHTELSATPWNPQHRLLRIGLKAKDIKADKLPPSNLVFLLDVSGSMAQPNKLPLVKASMKLLVDQLRPADHVAIVVYAGEAGVKLPSTPGNDKTKIKDAIDALYANGGTAGGAGITMAYQIAKENFIKGGNNRIILATDGDFNVGASSDKDMQQLIDDERGSGVSISILGFGMGNLKDSKMETMADKGHGNYAYIDNITEATKSMVSEFGGTLFTVAKDVKLQIEFNPAKVQAYRLLGYENRLMKKEDFNNDKKVAGDMGVGHTVTALYEIIPTGVKDSFTNSVDPLKYQKPDDKITLNNSSEMVTIKFRYKQPDGDKSKMEQVSIKDEPKALSKTSDDFRFAASVAELGLLLRDSEFKQQASFNDLINMAKAAKGKDDEGYRAEFIRLAESAQLMSKSSTIAAEVREE